MIQIKKGFLIGISLLVVSCGNQSSTDGDSSLSIYNGETITESDYPAVQQLSGCTGTFVSDNTLMYAKHCGTGSQTLPKNGNKKSIKTWSHGADIAVAKFPDGTAKKWATLLNRAPKVGDKIRLMGYGTPGFGTKRTGTNTIDSFKKDGQQVWTERRLDNSDNNNAGPGPGDSGGPLLIEDDDKVYTFAVLTGRGREDQDGGRMAEYQNLCYGPALEFLKGLVKNEGVRIEGIDEACGQ